MKNTVIYISLLLIVVNVSAQKLDRSIRPKAGPAPEIKIGESKSFELSNGLKVFVVENHKLPRVAFSLSLDIDPIMEGDMAGYVGIAGQMIGRATSNRTKEQIDEEIDFIGARLSTSAGGVFGRVLEKNKLKLLEIMSDIVLNSKFEQAELDKIKKQSISNLLTNKDDPDAIMGNVRSALVYGKDHPYGEISTEKTVEKVTLQKCKQYYQTYFKPNVSYLVVVGDVTVEGIRPDIEKYFGNWKKGDVPTHEYNVPEMPRSTEVAFVPKDGAVQSLINITYPVNLKPGSADAIKARVMNFILGGNNGKLFLNLRETHGYTYGAYSSLNSDKLVGSFRANAKVRNEVTDSSITQFMVELNKMIDEKITEEELDAVKNFMTGNFAYSLQNPQTVARFALNVERYNLPKDYYPNYLKNLAAITVDDIQEMAKKYIKPSNAHIIVVGEKSISSKLEQFSASKKVNMYDHYGYDYKEPLKEAPEGVTAKTVIEKSIVAKYGMPLGKGLTKKLSKVKDLTIKMGSTIQGQTVSGTVYQKAPNKFANVMSMGSMVVQKQTFNGVSGNVSGMQGTRKIEGEDLEDLKLSSIMHLDTKYDALGFKFNLLGIESIDGKDAYKLEMINPLGKKEMQWYDVETSHQVKTSSTKESEMGAMTITSSFSDFKTINGIVYPYLISRNFGPQTMVMKVTSVDINTKVSDDTFE